MNAPGIDRTSRARLVEDMLTYMTLDEKLGQLRAVRLAATCRQESGEFCAGLIDRLKSGQVAVISGVETREEAHQLQSIAVERSRFGIPLLIAGKEPSTVGSPWPPPLAMAASWDCEAVARISAAIALEAIGKGWNLVPTPPVNLLTSPPHEPEQSLGTSVHLAKEIACSLIDGLQEVSPASFQNVLASLCFGPLTPPGPERDRAEQLIRSILRASDVSAIEEMSPAGHEPGNGSVTDIHSAFAGIDFGAWRRMARLGEAQSRATGLCRTAGGIDECSPPQIMLDEAVRRLLAVKSDLGLFRDPFHKLAPAADPSADSALANRAAIDELARKSIVLLRNEDDILPLSSDPGKLLVVGSRPETTAGLRRALDRYGIEHSALSGVALQPGDAPDPLEAVPADGLAIGMACDAASRSDIVLLAVTDADCHRIADQPLLRLGPAFDAMIRAVLHANRRLALIELTRLPIDLGELAPQIPGQLLAWTGFEHGETALGEVLTGRYNPSGRLPMPLESVDPAGCLPFGHGLGYSDVTYSDMAVAFDTDHLVAQITVHNCGEHDGIETVLLYLHSPAWDPAAQTQLRCFQRIALAAGESRRVKFELALEELGETYPDGRIKLEPGSYEILLGKDAGHLSGCEIDLQGSMIRSIEGFSHGLRLRTPSLAG